MTAPITKKQLIEKIVKEQGVKPESLARMNLEALHKMDAAIKDADEDLLGSAPSESPSGDSGAVEGASNVENGVQEVGTQVGKPGDVDQSTTLAGNDDNQSGASSSSTPSTEPSDVTSEGNELGQSVSSEDGTAPVKPSESPTEPTLPAQTPSELSTSPDANSGSGSGPVERVLLGQHPVTEEPVYSDEQ